MTVPEADPADRYMDDKLNQMYYFMSIDPAEYIIYEIFSIFGDNMYIFYNFIGTWDASGGRSGRRWKDLGQ